MNQWRQRKSTTQELEDGAQDEAVWEEPVITRVKLLKCRRKSPTLTMAEVSWIQIWSGKHGWKSNLDTARCRCIVVSSSWVRISESEQDEVGGHKQRRRTSSRCSLPVGGEWGVKNATTQRRVVRASSHPLHLSKQAVKHCEFGKSKPHLRQTSHRTRSGVCNEPCTARVTRILHGPESSYERWKLLGSSLVWEYCEKLDACIVVHGDDFITLGHDDALREVTRVMGSHYTIIVRAILVQVAMMSKSADPESVCALQLRWWTVMDRVRTKILDMSSWWSNRCIWRTRREWRPHKVRKKSGRRVGDVPAVGRLVDTPWSQCGDEGSVLVAKQARLLVLSKGVGERHAETDRIPNEQSEATWTVFEETSETCSVFRRRHIHWQRCATGRVWWQWPCAVLQDTERARSPWYWCAVHIVSKCQVVHNQSSHSVVVKVNIMGSSNTQQLA